MYLTQAVARLRELTSKFEEAPETRLVVVYESGYDLFESDEYSHVVFIQEIYDEKGTTKKTMTGLVKKKDLTEIAFNGEKMTVFNRFDGQILVTQEYNEQDYSF